MNFPREVIWLIPILPLIGAMLNGLTIFARIKLPKTLVSVIACTSIFLSFLISIAAFLELRGIHEANPYYINHLYTWFEVGPLAIDVAFLVDPLSSVMILIVTGVGFLIHLYSVGYMHEDPGFQRFFTYLNLFVFFMLLLVLGENILLMFVGWEGVGLCSYLLIGFWFDKKANAEAGMKAFIVNRIGDFAFIIGFCLLYWGLTQFNVHTLSFLGLRENAHLLKGMTSAFGISLVTWVTVLFFIGATGKSAQIPLYVWLPDAMAGPTSVSALIHAATMVTSGVYMIGRTFFLFEMAPATLTLVATVGVFTAVFAGTIALVQNDIKKVLAYSTVSQLGYMFLGMGVGAFSAGIMHLMTHAFFKGLMFLAAGSVIHALHHEQDMRKMGGLKNKIPWTFWTFMAGYIAIIGFPFASGFISKDEILWKAFSSGNYGKVLWFFGLVGAGITAFYMSRLVFMTFFGDSRVDEHAAKNIHESPKTMIIPLVVLAILSLLGGFIGLPSILGGSNNFHYWLEGVFSHGAIHAGGHHSAGEMILEYGLMSLSVGFVALMVWFAWNLYGRASNKPQLMALKHPKAYRVLLNKYYIDEIYQATIVKGLLAWNNGLASFDGRIIDGLVNLVGRMGIGVSIINGAIDRIFVDGLVNYFARFTAGVGGLLRQIQTGRIQNYLYVAILTVTVAIIIRVVM